MTSIWNYPVVRAALLAIAVLNVLAGIQWIGSWIAPTGPVWASDGLVSVEMPGTPRLVDGRRFLLLTKPLNQEFIFAWGDAPAGLTGEQTEQALGQLPAVYLAGLQKRTALPVEWVRRERIALGDFPGVELEFRIGNRLVIARAFYAHGRSYAVEVTTPAAAREHPSVQRFFESMQITPAVP
jgi:hypothetical protein